VCTRKSRVLVVDDELSNLRTFRRAFRSDLDITLAHGPDEAIRAAREGTFDIALIDYAMPSMNGVELLSELIRDQPLMRRVMLTGYGELPEVQGAHQEGLCERVIRKPFDREEVLACIYEGLSRPSSDAVARPPPTAARER
jgi:DNA-binding NtrC family response regulator